MLDSEGKDDEILEDLKFTNFHFMDVSKNRGFSPKMDGENNGKTSLKWDDLGGNTHYFWKNTHFYDGTLLTGLKEILTAEKGRVVPGGAKHGATHQGRFQDPRTCRRKMN